MLNTRMFVRKRVEQYSVYYLSSTKPLAVKTICVPFFFFLDRLLIPLCHKGTLLQSKQFHEMVFSCIVVSSALIWSHQCKSCLSSKSFVPPNTQCWSWIGSSINAIPDPTRYETRYGRTTPTSQNFRRETKLDKFILT